MDAKENVIAWLNDAYGMENALVQVLEHRVKDAEGYPEIQAHDQQHLELTRQHATRVQGCIERLGGRPRPSSRPWRPFLARCKLR